MKFIKWKSIVTTCTVCLLPIILGITLWNDLPDVMAVHFNFNNEPDNFASKGFVVFGLPLIMAAVQAFCCVIKDVNSHKSGKPKRLIRITKWIVPVIAIAVQTAILGYGIGWNIDMRWLALLIVGVVMIINVLGVMKRKTE